MSAKYTPGQWWRAPEGERRLAYYRCMRVCYGMTAGEAIGATRRMFDQYPSFMADPMGTLRRALNGNIS